jgi:phosphohistidine phosphatase
MKTLLIMRHAKSSWKLKDMADIERPLNSRGEKDAPAMGRLLKKKKILPDLILTSPAVRARMTAELVAKKSNYKKEVTVVDALYMAEAPEIINTLKGLPDENDLVLLISHNPGLEYLLQLLTGKIESLPTSTIAKIRLPIENWATLVDDTQGKLVKIWRPKE